MLPVHHVGGPTVSKSNPIVMNIYMWEFHLAVLPRLSKGNLLPVASYLGLYEQQYYA